MSNYVPKVGDKVRATLGESVFVGEVAVVDVYSNGMVRVDFGADYQYAWLKVSDCQFEQVVSVPTKFGAVIRRADGLVSFLADLDDEENDNWWTPALGWTHSKQATEGGFTVLFEGVDE